MQAEGRLFSKIRGQRLKLTSKAALQYNLNKKLLKYSSDNPKSLILHPSSDGVVVRVLDYRAAAPGLIPVTCNETLSQFPKVLFLIEEQLSMLKFIMKWLSVIYYDHFPSPGDGFSTWGGKAMTRWWKSHDLVVEKPQPGGGKVNIVNDADITKPLLDMATRSR